MKILVTGVAGFIGFHLAKALIHNKNNIVGIDNINDYYDVNLKKARRDILQKNSNFDVTEGMLEDNDKLDDFLSLGL